LESNVAAPATGQIARPHKGYYRTKDGGTYFLFLKPTRPPQDVAFSKRLMAQVHHIENSSLSALSDRAGGLAKKIRVSYAGGYPIAVHDEAATKQDIKVTLLTSFLGVMILFGLSFRTLRILLYVGAPLAASLLWTLGFARLAFCHLNVLTCIFSCVLIGLGIDFAIHIVNRYFCQDKKDLGLQQRLQETFQEAGTGIVVGALTTSAAFYSIAISDFRGFREIAVLTGTGILFCLVAMYFLLPSLLVYFSRERGSVRQVAIGGFGLGIVLRLLQRYPRRILAASLVAVCLLGILGTRVRFDDNLRNFRPLDHEVLQLQEKVSGWLGGSTAEVLLIAQGRSEMEVMETTASIYEALQELSASGLIAGTRSISRYFLAPSRQRQNMAFIRANPRLFDPERIEKTFNEALKENGFESLERYNTYFKRLTEGLSAEEILLPSSLQDTTLSSFFKLFVLDRDGDFRTITYIVTAKDLWSRADTTQFRQMIFEKLRTRGVKENNLTMTGATLLTGDLKEVIVKNLESSLWLAGLIIVVVLFIYYRNLGFVLLSTLPLVVGLVILVGIMGVLRWDLNFFNVIVLPMIVGIGIDDGVHFTNTFRRPGDVRMLQPLIHTGRAVVLTSLTTLVGFGSISLSHYPGLKSMGYVATIGISACLFASVVVLPTIFYILKSRK
jgi:predicted RND superfamily exporter protein